VVSARRFAGVLLAALAAPAAALPAEQPARCRASVELDPDRAYVGQQVHYDLRILRRRDVSSLRWENALSFPAFRAEWLPGRTDSLPVDYEGESYLTFHERRALFPAHSGVLEVPSAALRCTTEDGEEIVSVPAAQLVVEALPANGRPDNFSGIVGAVSLTATATPTRVRLGESIRLSVVASGEGNLWNVPLSSAALRDLPQVEIFEHPVKTARDAGRKLLVRHYSLYDLVPRRAGMLELPPLSLAWFDPESGRYRRALSKPTRIEVAAAEPAALRPAVLAEQPGDSRGTPPVGARWIVPVLTVALLVALPVPLWLRWRRRERFEDVDARLERAEEASRRGDVDAVAAAASGALRAALARHLDGARALAAEELIGRTDPGSAERAAAELLQELELARFAGDRTALARVLATGGHERLARRLRR
jgi:hypothetical protein